MHIELAPIIKCDGAIREFDYELNPSAFDFPDGSAFAGTVSVSGSIKNFSGSLLLQLSAKAVLFSFCDRCLEGLNVPVAFSGEFPVALTETDDFNAVEAVDGILDLDEIVLANLFLSLPMKKLCSEKCLGLCPVCGANLNRGDCGCSKKDVDPRLAALKDLL